LRGGAAMHLCSEVLPKAGRPDLVGGGFLRSIGGSIKLKESRDISISPTTVSRAVGGAAGIKDLKQLPNHPLKDR